MVDGRRVCR